ncbi:putative tripeptidyl-peptidase [Paecilomyces variotii]|uniref:tripeptidyl-peptidase II n=1 Tax=Byssochlamys spectabilis TaxID=264951 RepID=A0A443HYU0_BYSSP|nr:putative tripeptidyl-peptidase [Paecilomyces variotii]KAJ9357593.1 hypothetical protein DTO027B9_2911 [Paecilomyces variotii]KAJ9362642.1 hypothetical protein DTO280E4_3295 [Paecilomyces variotii]KAJ9389938.1 hypothetical protein DTO063F5_1710 [Paecilomyces variotii]RWQ97005.1 putative tripeptidyl-peptidase [Paecilomyces variotii]
MFTRLGRGALSLAVVSLLTSSVAGEVLEKLRAVPEGWKFSHVPENDQPIRLQIALQQKDVDAFEQAVLQMSTPDHPNYGKHFQSHDEMKSMLLPSSEAVDAVMDWLHAAGVSDIEEDADWVNFRTTVGVANELLDAHFQWYVSDVRDVHRLRTLEYSVPDAVAQHINMIQPTTRFGHIRVEGATSRGELIGHDAQLRAYALAASNATNCNAVITPQCLKSLYNVGNYKADPASGSKVSFSSYLEEYARYSDLELFEKNIAPYAIGQNFSVITYNGGLNDQNSASDSGEANLDLQYIVGLSSPLPVTEYSTGGLGYLIPDLDEPTQADNQNEPYLAFLQNVLKRDQKDLPQVLSTSYGEDEQSVPERYARSVCNLYAQLGSRGVSVLFSSGDSGVGSSCLTNDGRNLTRFMPQFPASCPWVTSVGATQHVAPEEATFFSSGGFSDLWPMPDYQRGAVAAYLAQLGDKWKGLYNPGGRGFPDVAAQGVGYSVYDKGVLKGYEGTSCASPTFSALIALLNDARLKAHLPPLGFLNPWIYSAGRGGLNDIVHGGSTGCDGHARFNGAPNGGPVVPYASWNATKGWDPVTGLGTPDFSKLLKIAVPSRIGGR